MLLYCTADKIGGATGGGVVTWNERLALASVMGACTILSGSNLFANVTRPFEADKLAYEYLSNKYTPAAFAKLKLAHFYSGTFSKTIKLLKSHGVKITYTAAAHDVAESKKAHEHIGMPFDYPHLTDPNLWEQYLAGYKAADCLICPSTHSRRVMSKFGCTNRKVRIPHGTDFDKAVVKAIPKTFTVGYLGSAGADKGLFILLQAWKKLNLPDAVLLLTGTHIPSLYPMIRSLGGGNIVCQGFVQNVSDFYNKCSVYCQPSITEGFGIEVIEALAHRRPVIVSRGAGAADVLGHGLDVGTLVKAWDVDGLCEAILGAKAAPESITDTERTFMYGNYDWEYVQTRYVKLWKELIQ